MYLSLYFRSAARNSGPSDFFEKRTEYSTKPPYTFHREISAEEGIDNRGEAEIERMRKDTERVTRSLSKNTSRDTGRH